MAPVSRLGRQIQEIILCLDSLGAAAALIGGLALAPYNVIRATSDVDLLADAGLADAIDRELCKLGYHCLHRSADVANYIRGDERVDFLFANRPAAAALLASAVPHQTPFGELRVVGLEGLIAFKLQGFVNDPRRTQDLEDIRALLRANRDQADLSSIREYFRLSTGSHCLTRSSTTSIDLLVPRGAFVRSPDQGDRRPTASPGSEPFTSFDEMMAVIEALCPVWPMRPALTTTPDLRL
jgi:hypothetical protein